MKAEIKPPIDHNRNKLADVLPLNSPYAIYIEPTRACNLKCFYCMHATRGVPGGELEKTGFAIKNMEDELYAKVVHNILEFPEMPKKIVMSGLGEPLMNKRLPEMIKRLRENGYNGRLEVITNALGLNKEMADALIAAGLSRLCISIQGLTEQKYKEYCGVSVALDELLEKIKYFYQSSRGKTEVYIKIIDAQLGGGDEEEFYKMFGDYCDMIYIEHLIVLEQQMGDHGGMVDKTKNFYREEIKQKKICSVHTYYLSINADGDVYPCSVTGLPKMFSFGNVNKISLKEIWDSKKRIDFVIEHLRGNMKKMPICSSCTTYICVQDEEENIDDYADELLRRYNEKRKYN